MRKWVREIGAEVKVGEGATFTREREGALVESQIDLAVVRGAIGLERLECEDLLSDYYAISCRVTCGTPVRRAESRKSVDWDRVNATMGEKDEGWYGALRG